MRTPRTAPSAAPPTSGPWAVWCVLRQTVLRAKDKDEAFCLLQVGRLGARLCDPKPEIRKSALRGIQQTLRISVLLRGLGKDFVEEVSLLWSFAAVANRLQFCTDSHIKL